MKKSIKILGIARAPRFSPNSVLKDRQILETVMLHYGGEIVLESALTRKHLEGVTHVFSMGREQHTLALLAEMERRGVWVMNPTVGVANCRRDVVNKIMADAGIPVPDVVGEHGLWLKRTDTTEQKEDVVYCADEAELSLAKRQFAERGIINYVVQAHIPGDVVKFYGVEGTGFFMVFYTGGDGTGKFGMERMNGRPRYTAFSRELLQEAAEYISCRAHVPIYGGDAIITEDGKFYIIDFNDWPSFSRCRDAAADAMTRLPGLPQRAHSVELRYMEL